MTLTNGYQNKNKDKELYSPKLHCTFDYMCVIWL